MWPSAAQREQLNEEKNVSEDITLKSIGRRRFLQFGLLAAASPAFLAACGDSDSSSSATTAAPAAGPATTAGGAATTAAPAATTAGGSATTAAAAASGGGLSAADLATLTDAAKKEGKVNLIALPDSWANYKENLADFKTKYSIAFNVANPDGSSSDEITAVTTLSGQGTQPDSVDVSPAFAQKGKEGGLFETFKPSTWDDIPDVLKDPDGQWVAAYYGLVGIGTVTEDVKNPPKTWADLKKPEYKGLVVLNGDPRKSGSALAAVFAAALANGGSFDNAQPGIDYFAELHTNGNLLPTDLSAASLSKGEVSIAIDWTYNMPGPTEQLKTAGKTLATVVPTDGVYAGYYCQAAIKGSPNPNAGKLWVEWLVSDEGAVNYLEGGALPARYAALLEAGKVSDAIKATLPNAEQIAKIAFPTQAQTDAATALVTDQWGPKVAGS
ncbi:MAG TPA: ABC transporter substrate-binding protein [Ilumatobacteraceae bacterium]|nr:ABC transporter substrate-binding protein [Ilumatobacteraceae bacterium]